MGIFISQSVQNILNRLSLRSNKKNGEQTVLIPKECKMAAREHVNEGEALHDWLVRMVNFVDIEKCILEENIALIGEVKSSNGELQYVNLQALVTINGPIEDFYLGKTGIVPYYFRLDFDYTNLGKGIFKEPLPHFHTIPKDEPRIPLIMTSAQTCIIDFLEFLYMNYQYNIWQDWARNEWQQKSYNKKEASSIFNTIDEAYKTGQLDPLRNTYKNTLIEIKKCLYETKKEVAQFLPTIPDIACLLDYKFSE